jgi:hypothetical protein
MNYFERQNQKISDVDLDPDPQGFGTFAGSGSVTRWFLIRIHIQKWM